MKHESPEARLIREQARYIRILEEQLEVCKEQLKAQELLIRSRPRHWRCLQKHSAEKGSKGREGQAA